MESSGLSKRAYCLLMILLCFLWTSLSYLGWLYRLMDLAPAGAADVLSEVVAYLLQAGGLALFAWILACRPALTGRRGYAAAVVLDLLCALPSLAAGGYHAVLLSGLLMNLVHGLVAGFYLRELAAWETDRPASVFGLGYGIAVIAAWLLSLPGGGVLIRTPWAWVLCAAAAIPTLRLAAGPMASAPPEGDMPAAPGLSRLLPLAGAVVLLSLVKSLGFSFPSSDIRSGVSLELTRVFYSAGLISAGFLIDRKRQYGFILCAVSLVLPFVTLLLSREGVSPQALWCAEYLFFGFFSVFRVVLFLDVSRRTGLLWLSVPGLLFGRVGDALGAGLSILLGSHPVTLVILTAALFAVTVLALFTLYQRLFAPPSPIPAGPEPDPFPTFTERFGISRREQDVLRLLLERQTNTEISQALNVSENTVKFHVRNILQKTGCRNRVELLAKYAARP